MDSANEPDQNSWGPFGRPLFDDPSARALQRVGVVDVGSNSVRLVVFDGAARSPAYFYNEKIMCGLGVGLAESGVLNPEGRERAMAALKRFQKIATGMNLAPLTCVATAAVRQARDGPAFRDEVEAETGLRLYVVDGVEEARLSAQGVLLGWPEANGIMCDIGGSSMELAALQDGAVGARHSSNLAPQPLSEVKGGRKGRREVIKDTLKALRPIFGEEAPKRLYLVGGSWRAIARLDMARRGYPLMVLHEYRMSPTDVATTVDWVNKTDTSVLRGLSGISEARVSMVPYAGEVLKGLLRSFKPKEIAISAYGIREGMLYEQMPAKLRARDPLIEACRFAEKKDARFPGFGKALYEFIQPIFKAASPSRQRLIKAACLLHDVTWRAHPDYRAEVCFDNSTRANLGGLNHSERIFLGLALLHRYKNSRAGTQFEKQIGLLDERGVRDAETLGRAMRFGAMFAVSSPSQLGELKFYPKKKRLEFYLQREHGDLYGEVAAARLASLAAILKAESEAIFRD